MEQRVATFRVEIRQDQYVAPSWEEWLECGARQESLQSQVNGLKDTCGAACDFASNARAAIQQLLDEKTSLRGISMRTFNAYNASTKQHRSLSVEYDHVVKASLAKANAMMRMLATP